MSTFHLSTGPPSAWVREGPVHAIKICSYKRVSLLLRLEALFPWCHPSPQVVRIRLFPAPPHRGSMNPVGRHLMETSHVGLGVPRFLTVCTFLCARHQHRLLTEMKVISPQFTLESRLSHTAALSNCKAYRQSLRSLHPLGASPLQSSSPSLWKLPNPFLTQKN